MTVNVSKPVVNVREKLAELDKPTGIAGEAMLRAETPQEQQALIGVGRRNIIINGEMEIYQRNAAFSGASGYALDRWKIQQDAGVDTTCSQVNVSSGTGPYSKGHRKALQIAVTNTSTATNFYTQAAYYMEGYDASKMGLNTADGNSVTLSFWVKNSVGGQYYAFVDDAKSGYRYTFGYTVEANVWKYVTVTIPPKDGMTIDNDNTIEFRLVFPAYYGSDFTASSAVLNAWHSHNGAAFSPDFGPQWSNVSGATFQITGVQLELGKVATPFEHRSYGEELALCQRYYQKHTVGDTYQYIGNVCVAHTTTAVAQTWHLNPTMRAAPTLGNSGWRWKRMTGGLSNVAITSSTLNDATADDVVVYWSVASTTVGYVGMLESDGTISAYIAFDAEL